ncbi:MAG TPA: hypothetical protein PKG52_04140 [bacterium]|nr:hypothetical protein [bacterium]HPS29821.1 hypothetical protein [bacterium]
MKKIIFVSAVFALFVIPVYMTAQSQYNVESGSNFQEPPPSPPIDPDPPPPPPPDPFSK